MRRQRWRSLRDAGRLVWPVTRGYRLLVPRLLRRGSRRIQRLARFHRRRLVARTAVVAVVGSLGKTTTARATAAALGAPPPPLAGNWGVRLSLSVLRIRPWHRAAVIEAGIDAPGQMAGAAALLAPDIVVVTAVRSDHHRSFTSIEQKRDEKAAMVRALRPDGRAVLNGDDPNVRWMATQTSARAVTFGFGADNDVRADEVCEHGSAGTSFRLHLDGRTREVHTHLLGRHSVYAALAALTVAHERDIPVDDAIERLRSLPATPGRLEVVELAGGVRVVDDSFKAGIETIVAALDAFAAMPATRRVVLLGNIEDPVGSLRPQYRDLGARLAAMADRVVLVGSDGLRSVVAGAEEAGMARAAFTHVGSSVHAATALLRDELAPGDALLIKGASTQRLERVTLALSGRDVRCPAKICQVPAVIRCEACPLLQRDGRAFDNVHVTRYVRL